MCAKSITGRTQATRSAMWRVSSIEPSSLTRPITSIPNVTARFFCSRCSRSCSSQRMTSSSVCSRSRPSQKPGWMTTTSAPHAAASPALRSRAPRAIFAFFSSGWPGKAKSGAWTESAMSFSVATSR